MFNTFHFDSSQWKNYLARLSAQTIEAWSATANASLRSFKTRLRDGEAASQRTPATQKEARTGLVAVLRLARCPADLALPLSVDKTVVGEEISPSTSEPLT